jgi:hypothetical protein
MGCNCKKTVDKINEKYGDGGKDINKINPFLKILHFIMQILFGILCGAIIIVMIVPMLVYVIFCLMFGKQATFRIKKPKN